jgi:hypothetical protein
MDRPSRNHADRANFRVFRLFLVPYLTCLFGLIPNIGGAVSVGCLEEGPLLVIRPANTSLPGRWFFDTAPNSQVRTHGSMEVRITPQSNEQAANMELIFDFDDPQPWGLPFTFQAVTVETESWFGKSFTVVDWSQGCGQPGRSLFPGQSWTVTIPLPFYPPNTALPIHQIAVYGARN